MGPSPCLSNRPPLDAFVSPPKTHGKPCRPTLSQPPRLANHKLAVPPQDAFFRPLETHPNSYGQRWSAPNIAFPSGFPQPSQNTSKSNRSSPCWPLPRGCILSATENARALGSCQESLCEQTHNMLLRALALALAPACARAAILRCFGFLKVTGVPRNSTYKSRPFRTKLI